MFGCRHVFETKGTFYRRRGGLFGGQVYKVYRYRRCVHCGKARHQFVRKKRVSGSPDIYERQLRFSGIKPENLTY